MNDLERLLGMVDWIAKNINHNLNYIPDDKLDWHPEPEAKSALQIAHEVAEATHFVADVLAFGEGRTEVPQPTTRGEAQVAITAAATAYTSAVEGLTEEKMDQKFHTPFGDRSFNELVQMPIIEGAHHHGQIAYIQTLLGDTESHFFEQGT